MNRQILYDRDISITLYRKAKQTPALYKTIPADSFEEQEVKGRRVLKNTALLTDIRTYDARQSSVAVEEGPRTRDGRMGIIEFYQGDYRDIFIGTVKSRAGGYEDRYKRIRAYGPSYTFNTREEMLRGVRPDGTPFQSGDKVRIVEDGTKWNVFVEGSTSSAYTAESIAIEAQVLEIKNTNSGMKPDISLSINLLPNQNCYGATVRIKNLNMDPVDIRSWDKMVITAGYRTGKKVIYNCPIFSAYLESPNPDGVTVFEGLTVGSAEDVLTDKYLVIEFVQEEMTLEALIRGVAKGISDNVTVTLALGEVYTGDLLKVTKQRVFAQNGMAVLNWLQTFVSEYVAKMTANETTVLTQLIDNELSIIAVNGVNRTPKVLENVVNLDMVTGATFSGTALTVIAPWNPSLRPGDLFYMPPQFINGSKLPNSISVSDYRNKENLYRALTISVEFSTTESQNKMTILAVPAQWAGRLPSNMTTEMPADVYGEIVTEMYQRTKEPIRVGEPDKEVNKMRKAEENKTNVQFFDENEKRVKNMLATWGSWQTVTQRAYTGSCISKIAAFYLYDLAGGPSLAPGMGDGSQRNYYKSRSDLKNYPRAIDHFQSDGMQGQILWWPLITLCTYYRREEDIKKGVGHNWSKIRPDNPNFIEADKSVLVPAFSDSWSGMESKLKQIKDIWRWAYISYKDLYGDLCKIWRAMYYYLGGTNTDGLD